MKDPLVPSGTGGFSFWQQTQMSCQYGGYDIVIAGQFPKI
jgi:hypothetical protein